jgi:hypothetical protein
MILRPNVQAAALAAEKRRADYNAFLDKQPPRSVASNYQAKLEKQSRISGVRIKEFERERIIFEENYWLDVLASREEKSSASRVEARRLIREYLKQERHARLYVAGTSIRRYSGTSECSEVLNWIENHLEAITITAPAKSFEKLAANLQEANKQEFSPNMEGFSAVGDRVWGISIRIHVSMDVPEEFVASIESLQDRKGIREFEEMTYNPRVIFCNQLGWELLRRGYWIGYY